MSNSTIVKIEGISEINLPLAMKTKEEILSYFGGQYPAMADMSYAYKEEDGTHIHAFKRVDGTKN